MAREKGRSTSTKVGTDACLDPDLRVASRRGNWKRKGIKISCGKRKGSANGVRKQK